VVYYSGRDRQIEQLRWEVSQLKRELARLKAEDQMVIESLHNRVRELEMEVNELRQIAEATTNVRLSDICFVYLNKSCIHFSKCNFKLLLFIPVRDSTVSFI
jgi:prefoldin subunit 5